MDNSHRGTSPNLFRLKQMTEEEYLQAEIVLANIMHMKEMLMRRASWVFSSSRTF
jgi:hypothetical protein